MKLPVTDLGKPSLLNANTLFEEVTVVIADKDQKIAEIVRKVLFAIGCRRVYIVHDGLEVIELMKEETIDIVITDWTMKSMGGIDLAIYLRQSLDSPNRTVPIIMLTAQGERRNIETARNSGITEYVVKPFSAKTLLERIYSIVEDPRSFIICKNFVGPDRRRVSSMTLPPDPDETREVVVRKPPIVVPKEHLKQIILDDMPRMIVPDYALKKKIGLSVPPQVITDAVTIQESESIILNEEDQFITSIMKDVKSMEDMYALLLKSPDHAVHLVSRIKDVALSIKARAGTFGYGRGSDIASMLYLFCHKHYNKENKYHLIILEKHIQAISVIFGGRIKGEGGDIGAMLTQDLGKLIKKYLKPAH
jgi:two-component system, chemotaxis family, chemotaxis protein CheY